MWRKEKFEGFIIDLATTVIRKEALYRHTLEYPHTWMPSTVLTYVHICSAESFKVLAFGVIFRHLSDMMQIKMQYTKSGNIPSIKLKQLAGQQMAAEGSRLPI